MASYLEGPGGENERAKPNSLINASIIKIDIKYHSLVLQQLSNNQYFHIENFF